MSKKMAELRNYKEDLSERLADPAYAAAYLDAALEDDEPGVFLLALRDVAEARGVSKLAEDANLNRVSTYRMLSEHGNPQLSSLNSILRTLGLRLAIQAKQ